MDILQDLGWDTLEQRRSEQRAISVFKSLNNLYLRVSTCSTSSVHSYDVLGASDNVFVAILGLFLCH